MARDYYTDLRAFIQALDSAGKLYRWRRPVNKDGSDRAWDDSPDLALGRIDADVATRGGDEALPAEAG